MLNFLATLLIILLQQNLWMNIILDISVDCRLCIYNVHSLAIFTGSCVCFVRKWKLRTMGNQHLIKRLYNKLTAACGEVDLGAAEALEPVSMDGRHLETVDGARVKVPERRAQLHRAHTVPRAVQRPPTTTHKIMCFWEATLVTCSSVQGKNPTILNYGCTWYLMRTKRMGKFYLCLCEEASQVAGSSYTFPH